MAKHLQVRNVPDEVHAALRARAADEGISLSELVLRQLRRMVGRPNRSDVFRELRAIGGGTELSPEEIVGVIADGRAER